MNEYSFWFPGKPIAKKRPRFARKGNFVVTYSDQETEESRFLWELKTQWREEPIGGPLRIQVVFQMPIPASYPKKKIQAIIDGEGTGDSVPHIKKPDLDNLLKWIKDIFTGTVWHDDSQVYEIQAEKYYSQRAGTRMVLFQD